MVSLHCKFVISVLFFEILTSYRQFLHNCQKYQKSKQKIYLVPVLSSRFLGVVSECGGFHFAWVVIFLL